LAPVSPLPGEQRRGHARHVPGDLLLAGQQPFRQLGPPGIAAARQPRETLLGHPSRIGDPPPPFARQRRKPVR